MRDHRIEAYIKALKAKEKEAMINNIGLILLAILLIFMALLWFGVTAIPQVVLGGLAIVTAVFILLGR